jgi:hypothetical protein
MHYGNRAGLSPSLMERRGVLWKHIGVSPSKPKILFHHTTNLYFMSTAFCEAMNSGVPAAPVTINLITYTPLENRDASHCAS